MYFCTQRYKMDQLILTHYLVTQQLVRNSIVLFLCNFISSLHLLVGAGGNVLGLADCLAFFTGAGQIPAAGFDTTCTFNVSPTNVYPTASTCALVLTLPTRYHDSYETFRKHMLFAFFNHGGFGLC